MTSTSLRALLVAHGGVVDRRTALARGIAQTELGDAVRQGSLRRVRHGIYADAQLWAAATPWARYRWTVEAVLRRHPSWVASHHAALVLHGLPVHAVDLDRVDVAASVRTSSRRGGVHVHRLEAEHRALVAADPRALPPATACVLTAAVSGLEAGVVAMGGALHARRCRPDDLRAALTHPGARYGAGAARAAVLAADGSSESPGESRTRLVLAPLGVEMRPQVDVHDGQGSSGGSISSSADASSSSSTGCSSTTAPVDARPSSRRSAGRTGCGPWATWSSGSPGPSSPTPTGSVRGCGPRSLRPRDSLGAREPETSS